LLAIISVCWYNLLTHALASAGSALTWLFDPDSLTLHARFDFMVLSPAWNSPLYALAQQVPFSVLSCHTATSLSGASYKTVLQHTAAQFRSRSQFRECHSSNILLPICLLTIEPKCRTLVSASHYRPLLTSYTKMSMRDSVKPSPGEDPFKHYIDPRPMAGTNSKVDQDLPETQRKAREAERDLERGRTVQAASKAWEAAHTVLGKDDRLNPQTPAKEKARSAIYHINVGDEQRGVRDAREAARLAERETVAIAEKGEDGRRQLRDEWRENRRELEEKPVSQELSEGWDRLKTRVKEDFSDAGQRIRERTAEFTEKAKDKGIVGAYKETLGTSTPPTKGVYAPEVTGRRIQEGAQISPSSASPAQWRAPSDTSTEWYDPNDRSTWDKAKRSAERTYETTKDKAENAWERAKDTVRPRDSDQYYDSRRREDREDFRAASDDVEAAYRMERDWERTKRSARETAQDASYATRAEAGRAWDRTKEAAGDTLEAAKDKANAAWERSKEELRPHDSDRYYEDKDRREYYSQSRRWDDREPTERLERDWDRTKGAARDTARDAADAAKGETRRAWERTKDATESTLETAKDKAGSAVEAVASGLAAAKDKIVDTVDSIKESVKDTLHLSSPAPSTVLDRDHLDEKTRRALDERDRDYKGSSQYLKDLGRAADPKDLVDKVNRTARPESDAPTSRDYLNRPTGSDEGDYWRLRQMHEHLARSPYKSAQSREFPAGGARDSGYAVTKTDVEGVNVGSGSAIATGPRSVTLGERPDVGPSRGIADKLEDAKETIQSKVSSAVESVKQVPEKVKEKAHEAYEKAHEAYDRAEDKVSAAADKVKRSAEQPNRMFDSPDHATVPSTAGTATATSTSPSHAERSGFFGRLFSGLFSDSSSHVSEPIKEREDVNLSAATGENRLFGSTASTTTGPSEIREKTAQADLNDNSRFVARTKTAPAVETPPSRLWRQIQIGNSVSVGAIDLDDLEPTGRRGSRAL
jgi:hypothetical protein